VYGFADPISFIDPIGLWGVQFGDVLIGTGNPWLLFDNSSWADLGQGAAAAADGFIPFIDPFESSYADECGNIDGIFQVSRALGGLSRDLLGSAALAGLLAPAQAIG